MWLAVDAGNSNVVLGIFADERSVSPPRPLRQLRISTHPVGTADELQARIRAVLALDPQTVLENVSGIVVSSVVPAFTARFRIAFPEARFIGSDWPFSFQLATEDPRKTGVDRLVNAEAAVRQGHAPAILVDSGTATTICAVSDSRVFLGGAILPGIESCRDILAERGAQLHGVSLVAPERAIGRGTEEALRSGLVLGYASMIDGMVQRFKQELAPQRPKVIATGGTAGWLREVCGSFDIYDPELTLKGIAYLKESKP